MDYPNDDNADVLRRLAANGDDLSRPRDVDFVVVFPDQNSAETFAETFRHLGYIVSVELEETVAELPWDVQVVKRMALSHEEITGFENQLQDQATTFGGRNDGWGCLSEPTQKCVN